MSNINPVKYLEAGGSTTAKEELRALNEGGSGKPGRGRASSVDKAARDFEAYFVNMMMQEMRKTVTHDDLLGGRETLQMFESMLDDAMAKSIAEGQGLGLAAKLRAYMGEEGEAGALLRNARGNAGPASLGYSPGLGGPNPYQSFAGTGSSHISSAYGERIHPIDGDHQFHAGIDIAMAEGTPVKAAAPGKVVFAGKQGGYGNLVVVEHPNGYTTRYAHNSRILVEEGQRVDAETVLAESGSTGRTTGPHLHFEVRKDGQPVDPSSVRWARLP